METACLAIPRRHVAVFCNPLRHLIAPVLGADKADKPIQAINNLETLGDVRTLRTDFTV